jgi:predicted Zn-dependent protease
MRFLIVPLLILLAACMPAGSDDVSATHGVTASRAGLSGFEVAVDRVLPVAAALCQTRRPEARCDFQIVIDGRYKVTPNAYQTLDADGRPVLGVTEGLLAAIANSDELAFVLAHEAAHHIAGHAGASFPNLLPDGDAAGASQSAAFHDLRRTELEADALGAEIVNLAGFDPLRGARFFLRLPDSGRAEHSTHPDHDTRWHHVSQAVRALPQ